MTLLTQKSLPLPLLPAADFLHVFLPQWVRRVTVNEEGEKSQFSEVAVIGAGDWFTSDCHECGWVMLCLRFPTRLRSLIQFGSKEQLHLTKLVSYKECVSSLRDFMSWVKYAGYVFFSSSPGLKLNKNRRLYVNSNWYHKQKLHNTVVCQSATNNYHLKRYVTKIFNKTVGHGNWRGGHLVSGQVAGLLLKCNKRDRNAKEEIQW